MSQHSTESRKERTTAYHSHRPASTLLIASKRPLTKPSRLPKTINPSVHPASVTIKPLLSSTATATVTATATGTTDDRSKAYTVEVDLSQPPQPFLDPTVWERMKAAGRDASTGPSAEREEGEEERRRRTEREAEFGQMAVRGRLGGVGIGRPRR
ncbi:hypothetical protein CDV55_103423 [Aspergillus turcosus]|uniref:Uncharacterized protein n=1 Tax=Aspergillus turcosus TaxID=1245748 RepID=A0A229YJC2_9EURO|nr:hypothetical protein CDV55_103423 [Aspergillus turcosus]RLM01274.1 hypothetical protein CFD26_103739 [Aspergillus turcosus]